MLNFVISHDPTRVSLRLQDAVKQKISNVAFLRQIFLAAPSRPNEIIGILPKKFNAAIALLSQDRVFLDGLLPALLRGDASAYEKLGPLPSLELREWAAARLVPDDLRLHLINSDSWQGFLLVLFTLPGSALAEHMPAGLKDELGQAMKAFQTSHPETTRPIKLKQPSGGDVGALFKLLLGRAPYRTDDLTGRARLGYPNLIASLLCSLEFENAFLKWLEGSKLTHSDGFEIKIERCKATLSDILELSGAETELVASANDWRALLDAIWCTPSLREQFVGLIPKGRPAPDFARALINQAVKPALAAAGPKLVLAVRQPGRIACYFDTDKAGAEQTVSLGIVKGDRLLGSQVELADLPQGRSQRSIDLTPEIAGHLRSGNLSARIVFDGDVRQVPILIRPMNVPEPELIEKLGWLWMRGNWERSLIVLQDLDLIAADGLTHFLAGELARLSGEPQLAGLVTGRSDEWKTFDTIIAQRLSGESVTDALPESVETWIESTPTFRPIRAWLKGLPLETDIDHVLANVSDADEPTHAFRDASLKLSEPSDILSACVCLAMITSSDAHLAAIVTRLENLDDRRFSAALESIAGRLATGAIIRAGSMLAPELLARHGFAIGASKYAEQAGHYGQALTIITNNIHGSKAQRLEALQQAGMLASKYGNPVEAADYLRRAYEMNPDNTALHKRYLYAERGLIITDPLRWTREYDERVSEYREKRVRHLASRPGSPDLREKLADALVIEGDERAALDILLSVNAANELSEAGKKRLIDLCVKMNANAEALEICDSLDEHERSEWVLINEARALRALARAEEAGQRLDAAAEANPTYANVAREAIRNLFFLADFDGAAERGAVAAEQRPEDAELLLINAAANLELNRLPTAESYLDMTRKLPSATKFKEEIALFEYAIARRHDDANAIKALDDMFQDLGCAALRIQDGTRGTFDDFVSGPAAQENSDVAYPPIRSGPLVSVVMTSYNSTEYIDTAIQSILSQSYENLELIVSDDCSTDGTQDVLRGWQARDPRVRVILNTENRGTYVAKNTGILEAGGTYIALQDSDDWSHPDRIAKSVAALEARPELMGLTTDWLRMTSAGDLMVKAGGQISHVCCISLVFRRAPVIDAIGFFDSVRIEADMEYIRRIQLKFGRRALARLRWPLLFGRVRSDSLTGNEEYGISRTGFSQPRIEYQAAQAEWHKAIRANADPFMPFPLETRRFVAPDIILPIKKEAGKS